MADRYRLFVDGEDREARSQETFDVENPATSKPTFEVASGGPEDIDDAVAAGRRAFDDRRWAGLRGRDRARILNRAARLLEERLDELARLETVQIGRPLREMRAQLSRLPEWLEFFGAVAQTHEGGVPDFGGKYVNYVQRVPLGVVGLLTPWNHPLLILMKKLSAALAAGNSVVIKPSELAPVTPLLLAHILTEAGVPEGVINVVPGLGPSAGKALAGHPGLGKVDLTGGTPTGRAVAAAAGHNLVPVAAELGGKAPVIIFDDIAVDRAVAGALFAGFVASGQTCIQGARVLVQRSIFDDFRERFVARAASLRVGDPLDQETQVGPMVSAAQRQRVIDAVDRARDDGATVLCGGGAPSDSSLADGYYFMPTVVGNVTTDMSVWRDEIFGPVSVLVPFDDEADAVRLANDSPFGLAASVWSLDGARGHRVADQLERRRHLAQRPSSDRSGVGVGRHEGQRHRPRERDRGLPVLHPDQEHHRRVQWRAVRLVRHLREPALLMSTQFIVIQILNGVSLAGLLFFLASGLTLIFGLMRILNLAHGGFYLVGGYVGMTTTLATGSYWLGMLAAAASIAVLGVGTERLLLRRIRGKGTSEVLLTIGLATVLGDLSLGVWGGVPRTIEAPSFLTGAMSLGIVTYPVFRVFVTVLAIVAGFGLYYLQQRTRIGAIIRAGVDDREMVAALGINIQRVFTGIFIFGAMLAGIAGVIGATFLGLLPGADTDILLLSLVVVIIGGLGSLPGAAVGSLIVGLATVFGTSELPQLASFIVFTPMALVLIFRPTGLFGRA